MPITQAIARAETLKLCCKRGEGGRDDRQIQRRHEDAEAEHRDREILVARLAVNGGGEQSWVV